MAGSVASFLVGFFFCRMFLLWCAHLMHSAHNCFVPQLSNCNVDMASPKLLPHLTSITNMQKLFGCAWKNCHECYYVTCAILKLSPSLGPLGTDHWTHFSLFISPCSDIVLVFEGKLWVNCQSEMIFLFLFGLMPAWYQKLLSSFGWIYWKQMIQKEK